MVCSCGPSWSDEPIIDRRPAKLEAVTSLMSKLGEDLKSVSLLPQRE